MKSFVFTIVFSILTNICFSQFSLFAGGGVNITMGGKKGAYYSTSTKYEYLSPPYHTEYFIGKKFGANGGLGFSYLLKKPQSV